MKNSTCKSVIQRLYCADSQRGGLLVPRPLAAMVRMAQRVEDLVLFYFPFLGESEDITRRTDELEKIPGGGVRRFWWMYVARNGESMHRRVYREATRRVERGI